MPQKIAECSRRALGQPCTVRGRAAYLVQKAARCKHSFNDLCSGGGETMSHTCSQCVANHGYR